MEQTSYIPKSQHNVTPSLTFKGTEAAITWYTNIFGAQERMRMAGPDKKIQHAELIIGDSIIFLAEENTAMKNKTPQITKGNSITLYLYVKDVDEVIKKAVHNGAALTMPAEDMKYGDRVGSINDPFGYTWVVATHFKDVEKSELREQVEEMAHN